MIYRVGFLFRVLQIDRDTHISEFELNRESSALELELVVLVEIDQDIGLLDVKMENFLFVDALQSEYDLTENDVGSRLVIGFREN